jgi:glycerophosphoryl diester phosphodiesterase
MKIIAHRGASGEFPENSLLAFEQAILQKTDGIELDVHFHDESQQFIVLHDSYLEKTTNGKGHYNQYSIAELTQLSLGQNQNLTTLAQSLRVIAGRTFVNIELKTINSNIAVIHAQLFSLDSIISDAIKNHGFSLEQFVLSSFNHHILFHSKKILTKIKTAALIAHNPVKFAGIATDLKCDAINPVIDCLDQALVQDAHQRGLEVWVYTVDRIEDIQLCQQLNVDAIFTNFPENARSHLNNCKDR